MVLIRPAAWLRIGAHALAASPLAWLLWAALGDRLGADPVAALTHETGQWALRLLLACLAMTPLRRISGHPGWLRYRRMLGLWAFGYACVHLAIYLALDLGGYWMQILGDVAKRPFITVGVATWLLLLPLAATSNLAMVRRLGARWKPLHRLVYLAAALAVLHFWWQVKADLREPAIYAAILAALLALRLRNGALKAAAGSPQPRSPPPPGPGQASPSAAPVRPALGS